MRQINEILIDHPIEENNVFFYQLDVNNYFFLGCTHDSFQCVSGGCITGSSVCDGKMDCEDGSDELKCSKFNRQIK